MKKLHLSLAFLLLFSTINANAGDKNPVEIKQVQAPEESWQFKLGVPMWLAGFSGKTGVKGIASDVDVSATSLVKHLDFTAAFSGEARKGPFGIYSDFLYMGDQAGVTSKGVVSSVSLRLDQYLVDLELNYRLIDRPSGWLDVRAGCRYTNIYSRTGLNPDSRHIEETSLRLVEVAAHEVRRLLTHDLQGVLDGKSPVLPVPPLHADQKEKLVQLIDAAKNDPELAAALRSGIQSRIDQAKFRLQQKIAGILKTNLSRTFAQTEQWFDPYVGLAVRYNLTNAFYLTAKGDVGGFGAGSSITYQAYGALGYQLTRRIYSEVGYRYLYADYSNAGFVYDIATQGAQVTVGAVF